MHYHCTVWFSREAGLSPGRAARGSHLNAATLSAPRFGLEAPTWAGRLAEVTEMDRLEVGSLAVGRPPHETRMGQGT